MDPNARGGRVESPGRASPERLTSAARYLLVAVPFALVLRYTGALRVIPFASVVAIVTLSLAACGPPSPGPEPVLPAAPPKAAWGNACSAKSEADLMGWDAGSRANVAVLRRQGVLAVRFAPTDACKFDLELLPDCIGAGAYAFSPYPGTDKRVAHDTNELGAALPLFSLNVSGKLTTGRALRTDFDLAGVMALPVGRPYPRDDLHGQGCTRATHVVSRIYLGGFSMMVGESRSIEAAATIFGAGAKAGNVRDAESLASEGDPEACKSAQKTGIETPLCSVPLRLGLLPINDATSADYAGAANGKPNLDSHACTRGRQVWNGRSCEDLTLDPQGDTIYKSLELKKR